MKPKTHVSDEKKKTVAELTKLANESNSILFASIKNLPARQFQLICKKLRGNVIVKVPKKTLSIKAFENSEKTGIKNLKEYVKEDIAILFSKLDAFKLSALLSESKSKTKARVGQVVTEEITIEPGPTELVPGPIISQLSGLGLKFVIEDGKIAIKDKKVILKPGQEVSEAAADIMSKLDIKPISVGFEPLIAYESQEDKIYENVKIDKEKSLDELKYAYSKSLGFAVKLAYACKESIGFLIGKASMHEKALGKFIKTEESSAGEGGN